MHKTIQKAAGLLVVGSLFLGACQSQKVKEPRRLSEFTECVDPLKDSLPAWTQTWKGFQSSFVSIDQKFPKSLEPKLSTLQTSQELIGWRGERLSAQVLLWSEEDVAEIEFEWSDFKSKETTLPASIAEVRFVRYVMTDEFAGGCGYRKPEDFAASLAPDMLDNINCMDLEGQTVRPVWLSVHIPSDAPAAVYESQLTVKAKDQSSQKLNLKLEVQDANLLPPHEWDFHLDLWQHPSAVARTHQVEMWSDQHFEELKPVMKMLADAGQKVITATLNKDPWNNQCYDPYADMIVWTKHKDGSWSYDYKVFDRWVQLMMDVGIDKMINCYSVVPWNNELHYWDEETEQFIDFQANPGTDVFNEVWHHFFTDFKAHLKEKGWLEITNVAMDERTPEEMALTIEMLQREAAELGIAYADNQKSYKKYPFVRDISIAADASYDLADIESRRADGLVTTYYVCCSDLFPNTFTFSESAEAVYMGWYAYAGGFDGLLRWAYNSWVENPLTDSRFLSWPAGDTYIVYPQARSSIRFERLVEGIQDVSKVKQLKAKLQAEASPAAEQGLKELDTLLQEFSTTSPQRDYVEMIHDAKALLNKLTQQIKK